MLVIGITGGIASGKSLAIKYLHSLDPENIHIIDADKVGHKSYEIGTEAYKKIVEHFGEQVITNPNDKSDKSIQRSVLGKIVFSDKKQMEKLQQIVWPEIMRLIKEEIENVKKQKNKKVIIVEAALLVEAKWYTVCDEVWVLSCSRDIAKQRLMKRNKLSEEDAEKRINSQITNEEREKFATVVIDANGSIEDVQRQLFQNYQQRVVKK